MSPQRRSNADEPRRPDTVPWTQLIQSLPVLLLVLLAVYLAWHSIFTVAPHEQAVVLRFGKFRGIQGPGLHFMIPVVDTAVRVNVAEQSMRLPFGPAGPKEENRLRDRPSPDESLILTGDLYAAVVEWNVIWRVIDPQPYLFSIDARHFERALTAAALSTMHRVVGDYSADEVLTGKREDIRLAALQEMQHRLDSYACGVSIVDLQMQRVTPPERVKPSFDEVNASIQQRDQLVNEAHRERNRMIPQAEAARDRLIREAEGYAARRRAEAAGEIFALLEKYRAYQEAPDVTRQRLYLETMEQVIAASGPKTIVDAELRGLLPLLNIESSSPPESRPAQEPRR